jgi:N-acetyl sugar amidotransferase
MKNNQNFKYDSLIIIDENINNYIASIKNELENKDKKILAIIIDYRNYSLKEKNIIKSCSDNLNLDILMFTLRPEYKKIIKKKNKDYDLWKKIIKLNWIFYCLDVYGIPEAHINDNLTQYLNIKYAGQLDLFFKTKKLINKKIDLLKKKNFHKDTYSFLNLINRISSKNISNKNIFFLKKDIKNEKNKKLANQINKKEENLFWIGFDNNFKDIPWNKKYKITKWSKKFKKNKLLYEDKLIYCTRCCQPETMEGIKFDELGICTSCRSSEEKMDINWKNREKELKTIINSYRANDYYDCLLSFSGGKDSTFQAHVIKKIYKLNPLVVTHGTNWMSLTGRYNLENSLRVFNFDHLFFLPNRKIINKVAKKSSKLIGDACWHCHIGTQTFPMQTAVKWRIPCMIYGESIAERDGRGSYKKILKKEKKYHYGLKISAKISADDLSDNNLKKSDLQIWRYPNLEDIKKLNVYYLHLGDFIFWDEQKQTEFIINNYNWKINKRVENTYKGFKSNECIMAGVHDYFNFIKRGVGRSTLHASDDLRRGLITKEEAVNLIQKYDPQRPHALDYYLKITKSKENKIEKSILNSRKFSKFASKINKIK